MTQDKIKLFIVDHDSIFRLGLRTAIAQYPDFGIVGSGDINNDTWRELTQGIVLNVLVIGISSQTTLDQTSSLEFCQQVREIYPELPLFLLTPNLTTKKIAKIRAWGIRGYCDRSSSIETIIEGLHAVAYGNTYWHNDSKISPRLWQTALSRISRSGRRDLEKELQKIDAQLTNPNLSDWEKVFLVGRQRELLTARWLSNRLIPEEIILNENLEDLTEAGSPDSPSKGKLALTSNTELAPLPVFADSANKTIFERAVTDIQLGLTNRTSVLLEIDILQPKVQKGLCHLILHRISETAGQIPIARTLEQDYLFYLKDLWSWSLGYFLVQYYGQLTAEEKQQLDDIVEQEFAVVRQNIFDYIYGVTELFEYLLGKPGLTINNIVYKSDDSEAIARIEFLLHNLIINLANGVVQVILNNFYGLEILKYQLYKPEYRSDRELARFRNQLSWKYRQEKYFDHPQNIFESRHRLFVINGGIRNLFIYAPRKIELEELRGISWLTTIVIETRDAIAPLVRKFIALAGSGMVFVLTQVVGKALGLIGKGIIQGIGSSIKDINQKK